MSVNFAELVATVELDTSKFDRSTASTEKKLADLATQTGKTAAGSNTLSGVLSTLEGKLASSGGVAGQLSGVLSSLGAGGGPLALIATGAVAAGAGLFALAEHAAEAGSKINDLSIKTGLSAETLSGLSLQLKQSGTDLDALANGVFFLQKNLGEAAEGNDKLAGAFARLGITNVTAGLHNTDDSLRTVLKSLSEVKDEGERTALGTQVLGRSYKELQVFISDLNGDVDGAIERARKLGLVMSQEDAAAADRFGDKMDELRARRRGHHAPWLKAPARTRTGH